MTLFGEVRVTDDPASAFAELVAHELGVALAGGARSTAGPYRIGASAGHSGTQCFEALAARHDVELAALACYFVDERCVPATSSDSNQRAIDAAFGPRRSELGGFYPMDCTAGPEAYEVLLREAWPLDVLQLGFGPDGHIASLFPDSPALDTPADQLVALNVDPNGNNPHERLTLTYAAIAATPLVVIVVMGQEKIDALRAVAEGGDLPAGRVRATQVIWLCETKVAPALAPNLRA